MAFSRLWDATSRKMHMDVFTLKGIPALGPIGPIGVGIFQDCLISKVGVIYGLYDVIWVTHTKNPIRMFRTSCEIANVKKRFMVRWGIIGHLAHLVHELRVPQKLSCTMYIYI